MRGRHDFTPPVSVEYRARRGEPRVVVEEREQPPPTPTVLGRLSRPTRRSGGPGSSSTRGGTDQAVLPRDEHHRGQWRGTDEPRRRYAQLGTGRARRAQSMRAARPAWADDHREGPDRDDESTTSHRPGGESADTSSTRPTARRGTTPRPRSPAQPSAPRTGGIGRSSRLIERGHGGAGQHHPGDEDRGDPQCARHWTTRVVGLITPGLRPSAPPGADDRPR